MRLFKTRSLQTTTSDLRDINGEALRKIASGTNVSDVVNGLAKDSSREFLSELNQEMQVIKSINYYTSQLPKRDIPSKSAKNEKQEFFKAREKKLGQSKSLQNEVYKDMSDAQKRKYETKVDILLTKAYSEISNDRARHLLLKYQDMNSIASNNVSTTDVRRYGVINPPVNLNNLNNQANQKPSFPRYGNEELVPTRNRHKPNRRKVKKPLFSNNNEGNQANEDYIKDIKAIKEFLETLEMHQGKFQQGQNSSDEEDVFDVEENFSASYDRLFESEVGKKINKLISHEMSNLEGDREELKKYFANRNARCIEICNEMLQEANEDYIKDIKAIKEFLETHQDKFQQGHNSSDEEDVLDVEENFNASYDRLFESEVGQKIEKLISHEMSNLEGDKEELEKYFANLNARCIEICNEMLQELEAEKQGMRL